MYLLKGLLFLAALILERHVTVYSYPYGAPVQVCVEHTPHHDPEPQQSEPPYTIQMSSNTYSPGDNITVKISSPSGRTFRGFQMRSKLVTGDKEIFPGSFLMSALPVNTFAAPWYTPFDNLGCVSHSHNDEKDSVTFVWQAPEVSYGQIYFSAGVVEEYETFWVNVESEILNPVQAARVVFPALQISDMLPSKAFLSHCGVDMGCVLYPKDCSGSSCEYGMAYHMDQSTNSMQVHAFGKSTGVLAIGFSSDTEMEDDWTLHCVADHNGTKDFFQGIDPVKPPLKYNVRVKTDHNNFENVQVTRDEDYIYCSFNMSNIDIPLTLYYFDFNNLAWDSANYNITEPGYIFLQWGPVYKGTVEPRQHIEMPLVTKSKVDLSKHEIHYPFQIKDYMKAHSSVGIIGFLLLAPLAMFLARHFKPELSTKVGGEGCCGAAIWFQLHRVVIVLALACGATAIAVIFGFLKIWTIHATLHSVFGLVAIGLMLFQSIIALFRPSPDSSKRPIFTWIHRIGAILAVAGMFGTIISGTKVEILSARLQTILLITAIVWVCAIALWELLLEALSFAQGKSKTYAVGEKSDSEKTGNSRLKTVLFVIYMMLALACFITMIYFIAQA